MTSVKSDIVKIFGASVDASDDPWTLQLKQAAMEAQRNGMTDLCLDPYDALIADLAALDPSMQPAGKLSVPSWLRPIPAPLDADRVTQQRMADHVAQGGMWALTQQVQRFVQDEILPATPILLGVDHSVSAGVIGALSQQVGPHQLSVLILDQHFDGLSLSLRLDPQLSALPGARLDGLGPSLGGREDNEYCCGNFLKHLMDNGTLPPENLFLIGVADYPGPQHAQAGWERFKDNYLAFEQRGCHFFPLSAFEGDYVPGLHRLIWEQITTPYVYVSLDVDVGAYRCVHAARYMDSIGIDRLALLDVARIVADGCRQGRFQLAGVDAMEFNMHFLGIEYEPGKKDGTLETVLAFMAELLLTGPRVAR